MSEIYKYDSIDYSKQVINLAKKIAGISLQRLPKPIS